MTQHPEAHTTTLHTTRNVQHNLILNALAGFVLDSQYDNVGERGSAAATKRKVYNLPHILGRE